MRRPLTAKASSVARRLPSISRRRAPLLILLLLLLFLYPLSPLSLWPFRSTAVKKHEDEQPAERREEKPAQHREEREQQPSKHPGGWEEDDPYHPKHYTVLGKPGDLFQTNLKPDQQYITAWISSGWTNDVMTYINLLYLSLQTQRIPILGPFVPSHLPPSAGYLPFSEIFDLPALAHSLHTPILEWSDLKSPDGAKEVMGCWSTWMGWEGGDGRGRSGWVPDTFELDVSYTPVPPETYDNPPSDPHISFPRLALLSHPTPRARALSTLSPSPSLGSGTVLEPSEHLLCFDLLYYARLIRPLPGEGWVDEWEEEWAPAWGAVGRKMRWSPSLLRKAEIYLRDHFHVAASDPIPPYISVHMRRGDFSVYCPNSTHSCLPTLSQLQRRLTTLRSSLSLLSHPPIPNSRVLITSDDSSPLFWAQVKQLGYTWINHTLQRTEDRYGEWYPSVLDAAFLSLGTGFVGTEGSTMSLLAGKRVVEWGGGVGGWLRWRGVPLEEL